MSVARRLRYRFAPLPASFGGVGLGLSICKDLVELMRGRIGCRSELGAGTTFWFEIPIELKTNPSGAASDGQPAGFSH
jgi:signal transduction histidine kinase